MKGRMLAEIRIPTRSKPNIQTRRPAAALQRTPPHPRPLSPEYRAEGRQRRRPGLDEALRYGILVGSALVAGAINTLAGGGTLLTFGALMRVGGGLSSVTANGTSTVALAPGSVAGAWGLREELGTARDWLWVLLPPCVVGGAVGTLLATQLPERYFDALVPWLILGASVLFIAQPALVRRFAPTAD